MSTANPSPDNFFFSEFLNDFFAECDEHLTVVRRNLLELDDYVGQNSIPAALLDELLRSFHTLKGLAGMVGVLAVEQISHQMESYLRALRQGAVLSAEAQRILSDGTHMIEEVLIAYREKQDQPNIEQITQQLSELLAHVNQTHPKGETKAEAPSEEVELPPIDSPSPIWRFRFQPTTELTNRNLNVNVVRERLQSIGEIVQAMPHIDANGQLSFIFLVTSDAPTNIFDSWANDGITYQAYLPELTTSSSEQNAKSHVANRSVAPAHIVRVDLARIDEVIRIAGDLVISRARLREQLLPLESSIGVPEWRALQETSLMLDRQLRDLRQGVMQMRLVPIGEVFARMQYAVHDLARNLNKQIVVIVQGEETEIDKFVVERMIDPLLHMVRNTVSHGIETSAVRIAQHKPPIGTIKLSAVTSGDSVEIEISDDGQGIHRPTIATKARQLGLLGAHEELDDERLLDILCTPGFSTRDQADHISGRGIGMQVVQTTIYELGGSISLHSEYGHGTTFHIQLPLTLSIVEALIVSAGGQRFAVPVPAVREVFDAKNETIVEMENNELVRYRGDVLPLVRLHKAFGLSSDNQRAYALVTSNGSNSSAITVDALVGKREIVVRTINDPLLAIPGLVGATELGDGVPILILDPAALARASHTNRRSFPRLKQELSKDGNSAMSAIHSEQSILFELAGATYGIPGSQVQQVEMVEQITPIPNALPFVAGVVFVRGQLLPAVDLRIRFGFPPQPYDLRTRMIVVTVGERTVGLIVDSAREFLTIPNESIKAPPESISEIKGSYLHGIATVDERLILMLNLHSVLNDIESFIPTDGDV
jgi:Chemotaxis protein histidine kinase and related kinases